MIYPEPYSICLRGSIGLQVRGLRFKASSLGFRYEGLKFTV